MLYSCRIIGKGGDSVNDYYLIKKIANGNIKSLETLYQKYLSDVYRLAYMITKNRHISEDITQDVFLTVVKYANTYKRDINVKGWILTITRNISLNIIKRNSFICSIGEETTDFISNINDFEIVEFSDLLKCLNPKEQEIIVLHILYGLKHKEIANILSKNQDSIRKQYQRALIKLKNNITTERNDLNVK